MVDLLDGNHCRCNISNVFDHEDDCKSISWEVESDAHDKTLEKFCKKMF